MENIRGQRKKNGNTNNVLMFIIGKMKSAKKGGPSDITVPGNGTGSRGLSSYIPLPVCVMYTCIMGILSHLNGFNGWRRGETEGGFIY